MIVIIIMLVVVFPFVLIGLLVLVMCAVS